MTWSATVRNARMSRRRAWTASNAVDASPSFVVTVRLRAGFAATTAVSSIQTLWKMSIAIVPTVLTKPFFATPSRVDFVNAPAFVSLMVLFLSYVDQFPRPTLFARMAVKSFDSTWTTTFAIVRTAGTNPVGPVTTARVLNLVPWTRGKSKWFLQKYPKDAAKCCKSIVWMVYDGLNFENTSFGFIEDVEVPTL